MYVTTGELSKKLKISVRTIRYYDQIGLVQPSMVGEGGKRFYSLEDSLKLEKIILLKSLSLPLEEIKKIIEEQSTESILLAHKAHLKEQSERIVQAIANTNSLLNILKLEESINWGDLLELVVPKENANNWIMYFTNQEAEIIKERIPKLQEDTLQTRKWMNIIKRIELCIKDGISPKSIQAKLIVDDIEILAEETFDGNHELMEKFWNVRRSQDTSNILNLYPIKPEIIEFLDQAYE